MSVKAVTKTVEVEVGVVLEGTLRGSLSGSGRFYDVHVEDVDNFASDYINEWLMLYVDKRVRITIERVGLEALT